MGKIMLKGRSFMEEIFAQQHRPQRRRKTKVEIFKEAYLPYLILTASTGIIISFIFGAIG